MKVKGSPVCLQHKMLEFRILRAVRRVKSKLTALDFRKTGCGLFKDLFGRPPLDKAQESWLMLKNNLLQDKETHPNEEEVRQKCQESCVEHRDFAQTSRDEAGKTKTLMELNPAKDVKDNRKGLHKYLDDKGKTKENVGLLLNDTGNLVTQDREKADILCAFSASVYQQDWPSGIQNIRYTIEQIYGSPWALMGHTCER